MKDSSDCKKIVWRKYIVTICYIENAPCSKYSREYSPIDYARTFNITDNNSEWVFFLNCIVSMLNLILVFNLLLGFLRTVNNLGF